MEIFKKINYKPTQQKQICHTPQKFTILLEPWPNRHKNLPNFILSAVPWLKPWINYCKTKTKTATSEFESDLSKLQANATFGKTMEQVRHKVNIRLICNEHKLTKAVSKPSFRQSEIINDDLVMVRGAKQTITLNKPISVGFTILEISKLIMYKFYYDYLKPKYGDKCKLLFTDADSLCCHIQTGDL